MRFSAVATTIFLSAGLGSARAAGWTVETLDGAPDLHAAWAASDELWVAGDGGAMWHRSDGKWRSETVPVLVDFRDLGGTAKDDVWVAGTAGGLARWNGVEWRSVTGESTSSYSSIAIVSSTLAAATSGKRILIWDGDHWDSVVGRPSFAGLRSIAWVGAGRFVAVGDAGLAIAVEGKKWEQVSTGVTGALSTVVACGEDAIAVGEVAVRGRAGRKWKSIAAPPVAVTRAIARCRGARVDRIAAVAGDEILFYDAGAGRWTRQTVSAGASLTDVATRGDGLVVVGKRGFVATIDAW